MIRIKDIAEKCGVSTATVSYVLHGRTDKVSEAVRKKVEKEINESGYISNQSAISLVSRNSGLIGVAIKNAENKKNILSDPYFGIFLSYLEQEFRKNDKYILILLDQDAESLIKSAVRWNLDGLVMCNHGKETMLEVTSSYAKPVVTVDAAYEYEYNKLVQIFMDDFDGGYQMGQYFAGLGHTKVAMIDDSDEGERYRWDGCRQGLLDEGVEVSEDDHFLISIKKENIREGLKRIGKDLKEYTGIFCVSDFYALELMKYLSDNKIKVPDDISVAGYDDIFYSTITSPELTTIRQNVELKAKTAVNGMMRMIDHRKVSHNIKLPVELVKRDSCRKI